jgi:hypothetical protein
MPTFSRPSSGAQRRWGGRTLQVLRLSAAPGLVLLAPFVSFLKHQGYAYSRPGTLACFAAWTLIALGLGVLSLVRRMEVFVLAAALTFFVDVQFALDVWTRKSGETIALMVGFVAIAGLLWPLRAHAGRLVALMAATVLITTLLLPNVAAHESAAPTGGGRADLPLVVHIIFDEHIGIEGLPDEGTLSILKSNLRDFYQAQRFRVFGAAYSEHNFTERSIGHLFNFRAGEYVDDLVQPGSSGFAYRLKQNRYFDLMAQAGYALRVYELEHLELCPRGDKTATCLAYAASGVGIIQHLPFRTADKARLLAGEYLGMSHLYNEVNHGYAAARAWLGEHGRRIPDWNWSYGMGPFNSVAEARQIVRDLSKARRGDLFVAHLVVPHEPYVLDADCQALPRERWLKGGFARLPMTEEGRAARYAGYDRQVRCTMRLVREMIEAIPEGLLRDATVIVQGDHGSRLSTAAPQATNAATMSIADYRDSYSTLFAVRSPGLEAGYDTRLVPITCLFKTLVASRFRSAEEVAACSSPRVVFMQSDRSTTVPRRLPNFAPAAQ